MQFVLSKLYNLIHYHYRVTDAQRRTQGGGGGPTLDHSNRWFPRFRFFLAPTLYHPVYFNCTGPTFIQL